MRVTAKIDFININHEAPVYSLEAYDSDTFFSGGGDRLVCLNSTKKDSVTTGIVNTGSTIYSIRYIADKNTLLVGVMGGGIHVIDLSVKKEVRFLQYHQAGVISIAYSKKNDLIISSGGDGKIIAWSGKDYSLLHEINLCDSKVRSVAFDTGEDMVAIGCGDGTIRVFALDSFREIHRIDAHDSSVNSVCFHPEKRMLISGGKDAHLKIWDARKFELIDSIPAHNYAIYSISYMKGINIFATASRDKTVKLWDGETFKFLLRIDHENHGGHLFSVNNLLWINDRLLSASDDKKIIGWEIKRFD